MRVQKVVLCTDGNVVVFKTNILTIDLYFISLSQMPSVLLFFFFVKHLQYSRCQICPKYCNERYLLGTSGL